MKHYKNPVFYFLIFLFSWKANSQIITVNDGNWSSMDTSIANTPEGDLMVRTGDIDNMGFGWPSGFNPFSGANTPSHSFPWAVDTTNPAGTDRIMVVSSYNGNPPGGQDGYTGSTSRPGNAVEGVRLNFSFSGSVTSAYLYAFLDDFQAPVWGASYQVTLDSIRVPLYEALVNSLVQTGPIGKILKMPVPDNLLYLLNDGKLEIKFDDLTTGAGDGYSIDFIKLIINPVNLAGTCVVKGNVTALPGGAPVPGVKITINDLDSTLTDQSGNYRLAGIHPGILLIETYKEGYSAEVAVVMVTENDSLIKDFVITSGAPTLVYNFPQDNAILVPVDSRLKMLFSLPMNPSTFSSGTFILSNGLNSIPGVYSSSGDTLIFIPDTLETGHTYLATATKGLKSAGNIGLDRNYTFRFSTFNPAGVSVRGHKPSIFVTYDDASALIRISGLKAGDLISVSDLLGKPTYSARISSDFLELNADCLPGGVYFLRSEGKFNFSGLRIIK
jgi:hypothetical protein